MVSINFVMLGFCQLFSIITALKMSQVLLLLKQFPYQLPNKEYLTTVFKIYQFFVLLVNLWAF